MFKRFIASAMIFVAGFAFSSAMNGKNLGSFAKGLFAQPNSPTIATQNAPQLWEYRVVTKSSGDKKVDIESEVSRLEDQGFIVYSVLQSSAGPNVGYYLTFVLRRPRR